MPATSAAPRKSPAKAVRTRAAAESQPRRALTEQRRAEIIAAALKVFSRNGFHAARAEDVAAQAKVAKGTLYLYFSSKDAIYEAAVKHAVVQLAALLEQRVAAAGTVEERIRAVVSTRLEYWCEHGELYRMILTLGREKKYRRQTNLLMRDAVQHMVGILADGVAQGQLKPLPTEPIALAVMDLIRGANERRINGTAVLAPDAETSFISDTVLRYFR